jgi:hypothetical protein
MLARFMMMSSMIQQTGVNEEEQALQRAIEESRRMNTNGQPDPDSMTYEQLLDLGDRMGKVSKGLTKE